MNTPAASAFREQAAGLLRGALQRARDEAEARHRLMVRVTQLERVGKRRERDFAEAIEALNAESSDLLGKMLQKARDDAIVRGRLSAQLTTAQEQVAVHEAEVAQLRTQLDVAARSAEAAAKAAREVPLLEAQLLTQGREIVAMREEHEGHAHADAVSAALERASAAEERAAAAEVRAAAAEEEGTVRSMQLEQVERELAFTRETRQRGLAHLQSSSERAVELLVQMEHAELTVSRLVGANDAATALEKQGALADTAEDSVEDGDQGVQGDLEAVAAAATAEDGASAAGSAAAAAAAAAAAEPSPVPVTEMDWTMADKVEVKTVARMRQLVQVNSPSGRLTPADEESCEDADSDLNSTASPTNRRAWTGETDDR